MRFSALTEQLSLVNKLPVLFEALDNVIRYSRCKCRLMTSKLKQRPTVICRKCCTDTCRLSSRQGFHRKANQYRAYMFLSPPYTSYRYVQAVQVLMHAILEFLTVSLRPQPIFLMGMPRLSDSCKPPPIAFGYNYILLSKSTAWCVLFRFSLFDERAWLP